MSQIYQTGEIVPIAILRTNNSGAPQSGLQTRCTVYRATDGVQVVASTDMPEIVSGFYRLNWSPAPPTLPMDYIVTIYSGSGITGTILDSYRLRVVSNVRDMQNTMDLADGRIS